MGLIDRTGFRRNRHGQIWLHFDDGERGLLRDILDQLAAMLAPPAPDRPVDPLAEFVGIDPSATRPTDPALSRLFPDAYLDDEEASAEFRRYTQHDLRATKLANLAQARATLGRPNPTQLSTEEAQAWLAALNDMRLVLGSRLGLTDDGPDDPGDLAEDDPRLPLLLIYDLLTYHQDRLVGAMTRGMR